MRVLLIEDNPGDARLIREFLDEAGGGAIELVHATRLSKGLERLGEGGIDAVLLDLGLPDSSGLGTFLQVRYRSQNVPIVILSGANDETMAVQAVRQGAQDYLTKGRVDGTALVHAVRYAIERQRTQAEPAPAGPPAATGTVLGFVGAKGGVGTTTVALNVGALLTTQGRTVIAVELRPDWGAFAAHLNQAPAANLGGLLDLRPEEIDASTLRARLQRSTTGLHVLFGPQRLEEYREIDPAQVDAAIAALAGMAEYVVLDLPARCSRANQAAIRHCDRVVLMMERDPACVRAAVRTLDLLKVYGRGPDQVVAVLVNRAPLTSQMDLAEIGAQLECEIAVIIPPAGEDHIRAQRSGTPLTIACPGSVATARLMQLTDRLVAGNVAQVGVEKRRG